MSKKVFATDAIKAGFQLFGKNWLMHILFMIGYVILLNLFKLILNPGGYKEMSVTLQSLSNPSMDARQWVTQMARIHSSSFGPLLMYLISIFLGIYVLGYFLRHAQNRFNGFDELFKDVFTGKKIVNYFLAILLIYLAVIGLAIEFIFLSFLLVGATKNIILGWVIASILFILFIFYLYARLFFALFLVVDKGIGAIDAIEQSWKKTKGNEGQIILFFILSILLAILGLILFIVGLLVMIPVIYLASSWFYVQLFDTEENMVATEDI